MYSNYTIGIEEEFQTIDPKSKELKSHMSEIIENGKVILQERIKQEMHQSVVETGTSICNNIKEAYDEVRYLRQIVIDLAKNQNLEIVAAGTHPFSDWQSQLITKDDHYDNLINEMRDIARGNLIFGLHVHIGIEDRSESMQIINQMRSFLPEIFGLSVNSPFWCGRNTGFKSYRSKIFDKFPRTGIPETYQNTQEYDKYVDLLLKTNCIDNPKKIWWDIRLHPIYPTIEVRICDVPLSSEETICIAAIIQALVAKIHKLNKKGIYLNTQSRVLLNENKWRAARYGINAKLIDFEKENEDLFSSKIKDLLNFIEDVLPQLDSVEEVMLVHNILNKGTGADKQLEVYEKNEDFIELLNFMVKETAKGL
jgi:glutamate---cysteine ligase / carboxylate-amine ligase